MRISDWSSDVCSSDLISIPVPANLLDVDLARPNHGAPQFRVRPLFRGNRPAGSRSHIRLDVRHDWFAQSIGREQSPASQRPDNLRVIRQVVDRHRGVAKVRSEEHTSELQSLMRISYAVFCLK